MIQEIFIHASQNETRVAILENGVTQAFHVERATQHGGVGSVGSVYWGRITRVLPGMQSAFVDIGAERTAFLHVADLWQAHTKKTSHDARAVQDHQAPPLTLIEQTVFEGQSILVQIAKESVGEKGAQLSTKISLAGRYLVFLPQDSHIGISKKMGDEAARITLKARLNAALPTGFSQGLIVRTQAASADIAALAQDVHYLTQLWADILAATQTSAAPALLHQDLPLAQRVLRDVASDATQRVRVEGTACHQALLQFAQRYMPTLAPKIEAYSGDRPLFEMAQIDEAWNQALARRVNLKSGGYLVFDTTEAMTVVDVNTGAYVGAKNFADTILHTNLEAAQTVAQQLRLRNLSGIIVVDFIDMIENPHQQQVQNALSLAVSNDPVATQVHGFTKLGLMEITRTRTRASLAQMRNPAPII